MNLIPFYFVFEKLLDSCLYLVFQSINILLNFSVSMTFKVILNVVYEFCP